MNAPAFLFDLRLCGSVAMATLAAATISAAMALVIAAVAHATSFAHAVPSAVTHATPHAVTHAAFAVLGETLVGAELGLLLISERCGQCFTRLDQGVAILLHVFTLRRAEFLAVFRAHGMHFLPVDGLAGLAGFGDGFDRAGVISPEFFLSRRDRQFAFACGQRCRINTAAKTTAFAAAHAMTPAFAAPAVTVPAALITSLTTAIAATLLLLARALTGRCLRRGFLSECNAPRDGRGGDQGNGEK